MAKTQAQINARLKAYKNGTVDSPYRITKLTYREPDYLPMQPGAIDADKRFNAQCMDLIIDYVLWFTDNKVRMWGNAKDAVDNKLEPHFTWHKNTPNYVPPVGAIGVANDGTPGYIKFGHIWIVYAKANVNTVQVLEQNWNNQANLPPKLRTDNYFGCAGFWVPNVAKPKKTTPKKETAKKPATSKEKGKTLKYNRDEIQGNNMSKRGYKPKFIVIHNDAGNASAMQYRKSLVNAPLSRLVQGIAHSYISGNTVWQAIPEGKVAWHTGENEGNTNGYGIEVCQSMSASDKDFKASEQSAFQEAARMLKKWGLPVDRNTVRLHNEFVGTECPHRSMQLHAGYTSSLRAPQSVVNKTKDYFISQIKQYYEGEIPKGSTVSGSKPSPSTTKPVSTANNGWQLNQYGAWWKKESATFTCGGEPIQTRIDAPSMLATEGYKFQPGGWTPYDEVCLRDGYCWIGYNWQGVRYYLPVRTWNGALPPNHRSGLGPKWGTFS